MINIENIEFKKLKRISPSQYYSMKNCAYKSVLAEAFGKKPLLSISPSAYLGTVFHKILELISKGEIKNEIEFNSKFDTEIHLMEENLIQNGLTFFVPLQMNVKDFGLKKIQLKKHFRLVSQEPKQSFVIKNTSEKWVESKDKLIGGKIDLTIEIGEEVEIIDFKTGAITENIFDDEGESFEEVKIEYQEQLKLYAYLYFENTGKFPTRLSLIDLAKKKFNVEFSENECTRISEEAKKLLSETNKSIDSKQFKAKPNESNCKFCLYRPSCSFYIEYLKENNSFNDICGTIKDVFQYQNGNVSVIFECGNRKITVTSFMTDMYEYFNSVRNKQIKIFNLKKEATEFVYSATKTTKIYD